MLLVNLAREVTLVQRREHHAAGRVHKWSLKMMCSRLLREHPCIPNLKTKNLLVRGMYVKVNSLLDNL
jgi:hypothetical protein